MFRFESYKAPSRRPVKTTKNVTFRNIVFEERRRPGNSNNTRFNAARFIDLDTELVPGGVSGLVFENVDLDQILPDEGWMLGTAASPIERIVFENVRVQGRPVKSLAEMNIKTNEHVRDVRFVN